MQTVRVISPRRQEFEGVCYYLCGFYFQRKGVRLHRLVYERFKGPIPAGYHVHHIDGNRSNNEPGNLQLLLGEVHGQEHGRTEVQRRHLEAIGERGRAAAAEWHGSEDGKKWHREQYERHCKDVLHARAPLQCLHCGVTYEGLPKRQNFCGNNCKSAWRRASGVDDEQRQCVVCGANFAANKYAKTKACSRECGSKTSGAARAKRGGSGAG